MRLKNTTKFLLAIAAATLLASAVWADTLVHRNGSILKGTFVGFENGEFIFKITTGDNRNQGRTIRFAARDVVKLTLDNDGLDTTVRDPRNDGYPTRNPNTGGGTTSGGWRSYPALAVRLEDQWIRSNIEVRNGQRIRVDATGTVRLEGRTTTGPEGLRTRDQNAPEPNEADGVLLAGIGQDANSPSIVIGKSREFVADHDGMLYFTVNHGETRGATGAFSVTVQVDQNYNAPNTGNTGNTGTGSTGQERSFTVRANQDWLDTGIEVTPGMQFEIIAEGTIDIGGGYRSVGPEGETRARVSSSRYPVQDAGVGALLTKIRYRDGRDSNILVVGRQGGGKVDQGEYGRLLLGINDDYLRDNSGSFTVRVRW